MLTTVFSEKALRAYERIIRSTDGWNEKAQKKFIKSPKLRTYFKAIRDNGFPIFCMKGWDFKRYNLEGVDFRGLDLRKCDFRSCTLVGADFSGCVLTRADFRKSDLSGASFNNSHLYKADFRAAVLHSADFTSAKTRGVIKDKDAILSRVRYRRVEVENTRRQRKTVYTLCPEENLIDQDMYINTPGRAYAAWEDSVGQLHRIVSDHPEQSCRVTLVCGLPGSGKTTYRRGMNRTASFDEDVHVVFEACMVTPAARAYLITVCDSLRVPVHAVFLDTPSHVCLRRSSAVINSKRVPNTVIYTLSDALQAPSEQEGFTTVKVIRNA